MSVKQEMRCNLPPNGIPMLGVGVGVGVVTVGPAVVGAIVATKQPEYYILSLEIFFLLSIWHTPKVTNILTVSTVLEFL